MSLARRNSYRGQHVLVTDRVSGKTFEGVLKGWGTSVLQLWLGARGDEGHREFAGGVSVEAVLSQDECDEAGLDAMAFQAKHGRPATRADVERG